MTQYAKFEATHGSGTDCRAVDEVTVKKYQEIMPKSLLLHWQEKGWCSYADGLLWFVNPDDYVDTLAEWIVTENADTYHVFGRTAFGDLFLWGPQGVHELYVHEAKLLFFIEDIEPYLNISLVTDRYLDKTLARPAYQKAIVQAGPLKFDEMFGFEPAIALGGSGDVDTVVKVRIDEHLSILAQITGGV